MGDSTRIPQDLKSGDSPGSYIPEARMARDFIGTPRDYKEFPARSSVSKKNRFFLTEKKSYGNLT